MAKFQPESVALGAALIGQAQGDIGKARRAAAAAAAWLRTIDPDAPAVTAAAQGAQEEDDPIDGPVPAPCGADLAAAIARAERAEAEAAAQQLTATINELRDAIPAAILTRADNDLPMAISLLVALADRAARAGGTAPAPAPTAAKIPDPPSKPAAVPVTATASKPAPVPVPATDEFDPEIHVPAEARGSKATVEFYRSRFAAGWRPGK